ncbi:FtsK/SpoIIIE domain-containing protein [Polymorphospora rubra]|uniref:FtsK/SpoIIIE domain-containing protein n=1 Tax=Polymorphospora rubra TaxID=338584 RepID=UPI0033FAB5C1
MTLEDAERHEIQAVKLGGPVDPPMPPTTWADIVSRNSDRTPIVPAILRSPTGRRAALREAVGLAGYHLAYRASRTPLYAGKVLLWAPLGAGRLLYRSWRWAYDMEQWGERQQAATRGDIDGYMTLIREADKHRRGRVPIFLGVLGALVVAGIAITLLAPWWIQTAALVAGLITFARAGRPADKPILDRVTHGQRFVRLTAEQVRAALCSIGISGIKDPGQLTFPPPGIHRDGPGYLARVNLPAGVEAVDVLERRGRLSSALRLPVDQVWPAAGPDHAGQLDLWVGMQPASKMVQPRWSLAAPTARTSVFEPQEFGTDERQRPISTVLFARNFLIGGVPGSGKSYGARTLAIIAALDPTAELKIAEFKGTADFGDLAPLCSTYACGVDDAAFATGMSILNWGLAEAERRGKRIRAARERGEAPEGKVTPELAARPGSGLHPVVIVIDEVHELFGDADVGKDAATAAERLIKRGRALGIIVVLATQIPDAKSLPSIITRCVTVRWCMAVQDHIANDMILGTGAYRRGLTGTAYRPGEDAGWGIVTGLKEPTPVRSQFPTPEVTAAIIARATQLRGGVVGDGLEEAARRDVLADVLRVFSYAGRPGLQWTALAELLAEQMPEAYDGITAETVSAAVRGYGVPSQDVKVSGVVAKGCRRAEIEAAIERREIES